MLSIFYNKKNLNDCLVIGINNGEVTKKETNKDYILLYNKENLIGINIYNFSKHMNTKEGMLYPTKDLLDIIKKISSIDLTQYVEKNFVVGKILKIEKVENTKLHYCDIQVNDSTILKIICGAKNVAENKLVVVAMINTFMPNGLFITKGKIQQFDSFGMLCSGKELNLEKYNNEGIILLDDSQYKVGELFKEVFANK